VRRCQPRRHASGNGFFPSPWALGMARRIVSEHRIGCAWGCLSFFATPRMIHRADDGFPSFVHVHMMHDNPLLAITSLK